MAENNQEVSDSDRIADVRANYYALIRSLREAVEHASKIIGEAFHRLAQLGFSGGLFRRLKYLPTHRKRRMRRRLKHGTD